jgi:YD repeat-containing protein
LDQFGRTRDLHYEDGSGQTVQRFQYDYDYAGNRLYSEVSQPVDQQLSAYHADRSWAYGYDGIDRLISAKHGQLTVGKDDVEVGGGLPSRLMSYGMDLLGNFTTGIQTQLDLDGDGTHASQLVEHTVNDRNEIETIDTDGVPETLVYDAVGNLVFDGSLVYRYDAWNRLFAVNLAGDLDAGDFNASGRIAPDPPTDSIGALQATFRYGPLGRLIAYEAAGNDPEHYYYDGVRRIQTIVDHDHVADETKAEYVYGPDYVDEFVLQMYKTATPTFEHVYTLQDGNYNVMALTEDTGEIAEQYAWSPYGELLTVDQLANPPPPIAQFIGHQGLFRYTVGGQHVYYNRNRIYLPHLKRFLQRDPNQTSALTLDNIAGHELSLNAQNPSLNISEHYRDGMDLYLYVAGRPLTEMDPMGLFTYGELAGGNAMMVDLQVDQIDFNLSIVGRVRELGAVIGDRNDDIDEFIERAAAGDIDLALADYNEYQLERWDRLGRVWRPGGATVAMAAGTALTPSDLPSDFFRGEKNYQVYIGRDPDTDVPRYVGITKQKLKKRELQHKGRYVLKEYASGLTKKQARAMEQVIIQNNQHFDNVINSISRRHKWFGKAIEWATGVMKGKKIKF